MLKLFACSQDKTRSSGHWAASSLLTPDEAVVVAFEVVEFTLWCAEAAYELIGVVLAVSLLLLIVPRLPTLLC